MQVQVAAATNVGHVRQRNEDHAIVADHIVAGDAADHAGAVDPPALLAVMDGMGGHPAGDVASRLVAEQLAATDPADLAGSDGVGAVVDRMNRHLLEHMRAHPETEAMGTTLVGAVVHDTSHARAFAVGDSLALWWVDDDLQVVFDPDRARFGGITQVLGGVRVDEPGVVDLAPHTTVVEGPGRLVLSSDGLTDMLGRKDIAAAVQVEDVAAAATDLVERALAAGGVDNVTVVVFDLVAPA